MNHGEDNRRSVGKDERGRKEKREKKTPDYSVMFPAWEFVDYKLQTHEFFVNVRHLNGEGLNPKNEIDKLVSDAELMDVFGVVRKFKTTSQIVQPDALRDLIKLCWQIYGSASVTNNEFMGWVVRGYIAQQKGNKIDWAAAAASTALEKGRREDVKTESLITDFSVGTLEVSGGRGITGGKGGENGGGVGRRRHSGSVSLPPSPDTINKVEEVTLVLADMLKRAEAKVLHLIDV